MAEGIVLEGVSKTYGEQMVLSGVDFTLHAGNVAVLMGASGSGKTTIARLILGLEKPDEGKLHMKEGVRCSCVMQEDRLLPDMTALDNVAFVLARERWKDIRAALARVQLGEEDVTKPVRELSGGQRRRVALVRAMEADSDVVVLDEPFAGLDDASREAAFDYVREQREGRTLLLITHDSREAEALGGECVMLESGNLL